MKISELVDKLNSVKKAQGDLRCITPGFDESNYDDIGTIEVLNDILFKPVVKYNTRHDGAHITTTNGEKALLINW